MPLGDINARDVYQARTSVALEAFDADLSSLLIPDSSDDHVVSFSSQVYELYHTYCREAGHASGASMLDEEWARTNFDKQPALCEAAILHVIAMKAFPMIAKLKGEFQMWSQVIKMHTPRPAGSGVPATPERKPLSEIAKIDVVALRRAKTVADIDALDASITALLFPASSPGTFKIKVFGAFYESCKAEGKVPADNTDGDWGRHNFEVPDLAAMRGPSIFRTIAEAAFPVIAHLQDEVQATKERARTLREAAGGATLTPTLRSHAPVHDTPPRFSLDGSADARRLSTASTEALAGERRASTSSSGPATIALGL